jgi:ZIP family zinc transporter
MALTLLAGLSTGIGSAIAFFARRTNTRFLSISLGFSAGVMIYVSFVEILQKASESLAQAFGDGRGDWMTAAGFFGGIALIGIIDRFVPSGDNPHEIKDASEMCAEPPCAPGRRKLLRTGLFTALAITIHNFPEGLATFAAAMADPALGISIAVAIAIHNIPEGISVSVPIYFATGSRRKAFLYSFLSGLSEPVGAVIGYLVLRSFFTPAVFGFLFAGVAGIMVYISLDELLPSAEKYGEHHLAIYGLIAGMAVMAFSLLVMA